MMNQKEGWPSEGEASHYRRKARNAEHAAEAADTAEAKQFYLEVAKNYYEMADRVEKNGQ